MATGAAVRSSGLAFRLPARRVEESARDRAFETWRASIWSFAAVGAVTLATTVLNAFPGTPADEIVMASAFTMTGVLGHLAPLSE
jgi:hypothetical protein